MNPKTKEFAALAYALGLTRGELSSASGRNAKRILESTSLANIARALGMKESDLSVVWDEYLSQSELDAIAGRK